MRSLAWRWNTYQTAGNSQKPSKYSGTCIVLCHFVMSFSANRIMNANSLCLFFRLSFYIVFGHILSSLFFTFSADPFMWNLATIVFIYYTAVVRKTFTHFICFVLLFPQYTFFYYPSTVSNMYCLLLLLSIYTIPITHTLFLFLLLYFQWAIVSTLMVYITRHLQFSPLQLGWLLSAYGLATMFSEGMSFCLCV